MEPEIELVGDTGLVSQPSLLSQSTEGAVDLTNPSYVNLPREVVDERAYKAHLGMGELSPGVDSIKASIERGDEGYSRETSATELRLKERDNRMAMLRDIAGLTPPGAPVSQDEADLVAGLTIEPVVDPRTVWEKQYGTYLTNRLVMNNDDPDGAMNGGILENAAGTYANLDVARDLITKSERVNTRLTEMQSRWKDMGFWESAGTIIENIIPGKSSLNISGRSFTEFLSLKALPDVALPGNSVRQQVENLLAIPDPDTFARVLDETVDRIAESNVVDAIDFLQAVKSYSASDQFIKNVFGLADVADIGAITTALTRGVFKAGTKVPVAAARSTTSTVETPVAPGMIRLYHGGADQTPTGTGRWFSSDRTYAEGYSSNGTVSYVDLPENHPLLQGFNIDEFTNIRNGVTANLELPGDIADKRITLPARQLRSITKQEAEAIKAVDDTIKASTRGPQTPSEIAGRIGAVNESAAAKVIQRYEAEHATDIAGATFQERVRALTETMPTFARPGGIFDGAGNLGASQATRLTATLENNVTKFLDTVANTVTPERLTPEALSRAIRNARIEIKRDYDRLNDAVLDVVTNPVDPYTRTHSVSIRIGKVEGETFTSSNEANLFARDIYQLPQGSYTVGQQGSSFFIDVMKPIRETSTNVQDAMVTTNNSTTLPNLATAFIQGYRTPAEIYSTLQKANRDTALLGNTNFVNFLTEVAAPIGRLSKNQRRNLNHIMAMNRDYVDEAGTRGRYYDTVQDLTEAYVKPEREGGLNRLPTEGEIEAYYSAVQINEMDWMMRNFTAYRDLSRQGIEEFQVRVGYSGYSEYGAPKFVTTPNFKARETNRIPWEDDDMLPVAVLDEQGVGAKIVYRSSPQSDRDFINDLLKNQNYKIIQVARPQERVLKEAASIKEPIQYIVTKGHTKAPLSFQQVGRNPGFHVEYADGFYIKQPRVSVMQGGSRMYEGDATLWSVPTGAQGRKFAQRVDELRKAIQNGVKDLSPYIRDKLPENEAWWRRQFDPEDGYFSVDQPFHVVPRGQTSRDVDPSVKALRDLSDSKHTLTADMDRKFQGERSQALLTPVDATEERPVISLRLASLIDPLTTTSRGIGQSSRSRYFGDMKISVAEQWVKEFGDMLDATPQELAKYPMYYLHNPPWKSNVSEQGRLAAAQAIQKTTMEFVGQQTPFGRTFQWVQDKLMDSVYDSTGGKAVDKLRTPQDFINSRDPLAYFRAWAFRAKMGFFNIQQLFVQSQGLAHILAIAPQHAIQAMSAYPFTRAMALNSSPEIVRGAAKKLAQLGWQSNHFEESMALMNRTGWGNVGREATFIDDMSDPKLYEGQIGKWLDKSAIVFTETERMIRTVGWHAAYREFRAKNPNLTIGNREIGQILSRADTMTMNMTNASKASWERGIMSVPAQFQSYAVRIFEQMWGGQLSAGEKARVIALNSALYGVPAGLSVGLAYPFYDDIKQYALEHGYTVNDTFIEGMIEGIPAMVISAMGGGDVNFGQRFGPGGLTWIKDLQNSEKSIIEVALGPSGSVYKDIFFSALPAGAVAVAKALTGDGYEPEVQDLIDAARTITTVNAADRIYMAMVVGKYISRKGTVLSDTTTPEAVVSAITGLQFRDFTDTMIQNRSIKDTDEYQRKVRQEVNKYLSRALRAAATGQEDVAEQFMTKARSQVILGDFTPQELTAIFNSVMQGKDRTLVDRVRRDWVMKAPASQRLERLQRMENPQ